MIAYLLLCLASVSAGLGVLSLMRFNLQERRMLFAAPALTLSVWAITLGIGVSMGATVRQISPAFWIMTVVLSVRGLMALRHTVSLEVFKLLSCAVVLPLALLALDVIRGLMNYVGSPSGDGWSYVAFGQYLWEVPKTTSGTLTPLLQYASHLNGTRFIGAGLLGAFSPLSGMPGDTQTAVGAFVAWSIFTLGCSCLAVTEALRLARRWQMLAISLAVLSPWVLGAVQMHNYDNLIALSFLPAILAVLTHAREAPARTGAICGVMLGASLYTYPELAGIIWLGAALCFVGLLVRRGGREVWRGAAVALGLALVVAVPGRADLTNFFVRQASHAAVAGTRPGEGGFPELLVPSNWPAVAWRLTPAGDTPFPAVLTIAAHLVAVCAIAFIVFGYVQLVRRGRWDLAGLGLLFIAGVFGMVVREQYGYGAYKLLLFGWWLHCIAAVLAAEAVAAWIRGSGRAVHLAASIGMMALAGTLLGATASRSVAFHAGLRAPSIAPYRQLVEADRIIGADPVIVDIDDDFANAWAVYFLRTHAIYMMQHRGYMSQPHLVELMNTSAPIDLARVRFVLGVSALPGGKVVWSGGRYVLSQLPAAGVALIKQVRNANGNEQMNGRPFYWLGQGETELQVISTATGEGLLTANFVRGPSLPERGDRHLMMTVNHGPGRVLAVDADRRQVIPVGLRIGTNLISFRTLDPPSQPVPRDPRCCLLLGMDSPRLSIARSVSVHASLVATASSDDRVGCGAGALAPDGKPDLRFRVTVNVDAPLDLSAVELLRGGVHPGIWSTGTKDFVLGIAPPGAATLLGDTSGTLRGQPYAAPALELFACDDGFSSRGDTFVARLVLSNGQVVETSATPARIH